MSHCTSQTVPLVCTMQGQNNWGNKGSSGVMKLWVAWEVLRWLMKFRELCSAGFHPKLVTPPYHGFLNVNTPPNSQNSKRHLVQRNTEVPVGKHNNRQHASPHHEVATDVKQMPIRPIIISGDFTVIGSVYRPEQTIGWGLTLTT